MSHSDVDARGQLLDTVAQATDAIGGALASLGEAYEQLDEHAADRLEAALFAPVQKAYGLARRTHAEFGARHGLAPREFVPQPSGPTSLRARGLIDHAVAGLQTANDILAGLQDSGLPVEYGDVALRTGIAQTRELIAPLPGHARELIRTLGR